MAIGAELFAQMGARPRSFDEYAQAADQRRINALNLDAGKLQYSNALQAAQDEASYRDAVKTFGADSGANVNALRSLGLGKQAMAYEKAALDAKKTQADTYQSTAAGQASEASAEKNRFDIEQAKIGTGMKILQAGTSPQAVLQLLTQSVESGTMTIEQAKQNLVGMPQDPAQFSKWRDGQLMQGMDMAKRLEAQRQAADAAERARHNKATEGLTARGQNQQLTIANMVDQRQRDLNETTKVDKAAIRKAEQNDKEITKYSNTLQKEGIPELEAAVSGAESVMTKYPKGQVPGIGPLKNIIPAGVLSAEGKDTRQALAQVRNIVLSARSGAAVTDQELRRLVEEIGTGAGMTEDDIRLGLGRIRERLETIKSNAAAGVSDDVKNAYEERGGVKITRGGAKPQKAPAADPVAAALEKYK
jgi:hypothetical protein